jgi:hypothetical protein
MGKTTKSRDAALKAKTAFEAAKGEKTIMQLASEYVVHPNQPAGRAIYKQRIYGQTVKLWYYYQHG